MTLTEKRLLYLDLAHNQKMQIATNLVKYGSFFAYKPSILEVIPASHHLYQPQVKAFLIYKAYFPQEGQMPDLLVDL